jgi:hypothetical protein
MTNVRTSPAIWDADGKATRLKSGKFGAEATAISNTGYVGGYEYLSRLASDYTQTYAPRLWKDGDPVELAPPPSYSGDPALLRGDVTDVNDDGVAIAYVTANTQSMVFRTGIAWKDGVATQLGTGDEWLDPARVNAAGSIAGIFYAQIQYASNGGTTTTNVPKPALWINGEISAFDYPETQIAPDEKGQGGDSSIVAGLSDDDLMLIRFYRYDGMRRARSYLYDRGKPVQLESPDPDLSIVDAVAINGRGAAIGTAMSEDLSKRLLVRWDDGEPTDLSALLPKQETIDIAALIAINDDGVILARGYDLDRLPHIVLLKPV